MQNRLNEVWDRARAYYSANLSDRERQRISTVTSQEELLQHVDTLKVKYSNQMIIRSVRKTQPLIAQLRSFTQIINIFVQNNEISSLIWGPLALIFEVVSYYSPLGEE